MIKKRKKKNAHSCHYCHYCNYCNFCHYSHKFHICHYCHYCHLWSTSTSRHLKLHILHLESVSETKGRNNIERTMIELHSDKVNFATGSYLEEKICSYLDSTFLDALFFLGGHFFSLQKLPDTWHLPYFIFIFIVPFLSVFVLVLISLHVQRFSVSSM